MELQSKSADAKSPPAQKLGYPNRVEALQVFPIGTIGSTCFGGQEFKDYFILPLSGRLMESRISRKQLRRWPFRYCFQILWKFSPVRCPSVYLYLYSCASGGQITDMLGTLRKSSGVYNKLKSPSLIPASRGEKTFLLQTIIQKDISIFSIPFFPIIFVIAFHRRFHYFCPRVP